MKKKKILVIAILTCIGFKGLAQNSDHEIVGRVVDILGKPVSGALITSKNDPLLKKATDSDGRFVIEAKGIKTLSVFSPAKGFKTVDINSDKTISIILTKADETVNIGYDINQSLEETTASVSIITGDDVNKKGAKNISNTLFGLGLGLTALQKSGNYATSEPTFYIRGLQSSSGSKPLILIDGIERDMSYVTSEEVESVTILKDASAIALYGYKGINGAINVVTKRGKYGTREIKVSYDHVINWEARRPKFVNSLTYANAVNEALNNEGQLPRYSDTELDAFRTGKYSNLYPDVNWMKETFKNTGASNLYNVSLRGGGTSFRYYTLVNLQSNNGFVSEAKTNDGYSTQNQFSKANVRTNLDVDLTPTTKMVVNLLGTLSETRSPGDSINNNLWDMIYTLPSAAFPIHEENGLWGGNATWNGTMNPVAQSRGAGYSKAHIRSLFADLTLNQDLSGILPGLAGSFKLAYDNIASYWENHSKTYEYGSQTVTSWKDGSPDEINTYKGGTNGTLSDKSDLNSWSRNFNFAISANYNKTFNKNHKLYSQLKWDYEYRNLKALNNTWYRHNVSLYSHYVFKERYIADLTLVLSGSNKLAPSHKWAFSPTVSAAWLLSKEDFLKDISFLELLKLRTSFGVINVDNIPEEGYWEQVYEGGGLYNFNSGYASTLGSWKQGRLATINPTHEKAFKYNIGVDATLFKGLNITAEGYYQRRKDIFVNSGGKYSTVLGVSAPYENAGIVDSWGIEFGADYAQKAGDITLFLGANFTLAKNKIKEQLEEPQLYSNLVKTNKPLNQIYGLEAIGFFKDQAEIDAYYPQMFNTVKPGDIKYRDVNGDKVIDSNDITAIGYSDVSPEIYYSFKLGAEWKNFGFTSLFQGVGNYSAILNTKSLYWPLINNTNISQEYYDNRWTTDNLDPKYPRLSSQSNNNNYQTNTIWVKDRSFLKLRHVELYYNFPKSMLEKTQIMNRAKLYVRGVDLLCFDNIKIADPESYGATNPLMRSVVIGLSVVF